MKNAILVQGASIIPVTDLNDKSLQKMTDDLGLQINGNGDIAKSLNGFTVARLSGYLIVYDYPAVIAWLRKRLQLTDGHSIVSKPAVITTGKPGQQAIKKPVVKSNDPNRAFNPNE